MAEPSDELLARARALAGRPLGQVAAALDRPLPPDLSRAKGWVGKLVEQALGVEGAGHRGPDLHLADGPLEVKTIPVSAQGRPRESTFVCRIRLAEMRHARFAGSLVELKLRRVLWIPVEAEPSLALAARKLGNPLLWSPSADERALLAADWDELAELIAAGRVELITAHRGKVLQVRPKAADARERTAAWDEEGGLTETLPRGFYLRARFTAAILARHYALG